MCCSPRGCRACGNRAGRQGNNVFRLDTPSKTLQVLWFGLRLTRSSSITSPVVSDVLEPDARESFAEGTLLAAPQNSSWGTTLPQRTPSLHGIAHYRVVGSSSISNRSSFGVPAKASPPTIKTWSGGELRVGKWCAGGREIQGHSDSKQRTEKKNTHAHIHTRRDLVHEKMADPSSTNDCKTDNKRPRN